MVYQAEEIGFIETPGSIQRKIDTLRDAWSSLAKDAPDNKLVQSEYQKFLKWYEATSSGFSKIFASSIAPEFESWTRRYEAAYQNARSAAPSATMSSPAPNTLIPVSGESSLYWPLIAVAGAVGLYAISKIFRG